MPDVPPIDYIMFIAELSAMRGSGEDAVLRRAVEILLVIGPDAEAMAALRAKDARRARSRNAHAGPLGPGLRYEILSRDGFRCVLCVLCGLAASDGVALEVDHIVAVARGGKTVRANLRTLCVPCNAGKKDRP